MPEFVITIKTESTYKCVVKANSKDEASCMFEETDLGVGIPHGNPNYLGQLNGDFSETIIGVNEINVS